MSFIVLIPARLKSTRLANKPLAEIHGQPMIARVVERAKKSGADRVVVATDSRQILDILLSLGHEAVMTRTDHHCGTERLAEAAEILKLDSETIVVNVQGDEPLIDPKLIDAVSAMLAADAELSVCTAAYPIESESDFFNPNRVKVVLDQRGQALYFSRAPIPCNAVNKSDLPSAAPKQLGALQHIGLYAYRVCFLKAYCDLAVSPLEKIESLEQLRVLWHGHTMGVYVSEQTPEIGVDTLKDLEYIRTLF